MSTGIRIAALGIALAIVAPQLVRSADAQGPPHTNHREYRLGYIEIERAAALLCFLGYEVMRYDDDGTASSACGDAASAASDPANPTVYVLHDAKVKGPILNSASKVAGLGGNPLPEVSDAIPMQRLLIAWNENEADSDATTAARRAVQELLALLHDEIDVPAKQILVEALVLELDRDRLTDLSLGLLAKKDGQTARFGLDENSAFQPFTYVFERPSAKTLLDFTGRLSALVDRGEGKVLSRPSVLVLDGRQARIKVGNKVPYVETLTTEFGTTVTSSTKWVDVGITLNLRPRASGDNSHVTMQVETLISGASAGGGQGIGPPISAREVQTLVRVANDTPFVIGGLIRTSDSDRISGIPVLAKIPGLGRLFRRTVKVRDAKEVVVVIIPHVIPPEDRSLVFSIADDSSLFDQSGRDLFRNVYRVRKEDVFDLDFIRGSTFYRCLEKTAAGQVRSFSKKLLEANRELVAPDDTDGLVRALRTWAAEDPESLVRSVRGAEDGPRGADAGLVTDQFVRLLQGEIPGEKILVKRMLLEIVEKHGLGNLIGTDKIIFFEDKQGGEILSVAALPDGRLISGSYDKTLRVWDAAPKPKKDDKKSDKKDDGKDPPTLTGHTGWVRAVAVLPGRAGAKSGWGATTKVVSGSGDTTVRIWNPASGETLRTLKGHTGEVLGITVLDDGRVISGSADTTLRIWDPRSGESLRTLEGHEGRVNSVAVLPDGRLVSGSSDKTIRIWDLKGEAAASILGSHEGEVLSIAALPDGRLVSGSSDKTIRVWDSDSGEAPRILNGHKGSVVGLAILPRVEGVASGPRSKTLVISGSDDGTLRVWDPEGGDALRILEGERHGVTSLTVLPRLEGIASGWGAKTMVAFSSGAGDLRVWDPEGGEKPRSLERPSGTGGARAILEIEALADQLAPLDRPCGTVGMLYGTGAASSALLFDPPSAKIFDLGVIEKEGYLCRMRQNNCLGSGGSRWDRLAILLNQCYTRSDQSTLKTLKSVLVLKRLLDLNPTLPLTLAGFHVGIEIVMPTERDLRDRSHLVDREAAQLYFETLDYYYAFELAIRAGLASILRLDLEPVPGCTASDNRFKTVTNAELDAGCACTSRTAARTATPAKGTAPAEAKGPAGTEQTPPEGLSEPPGATVAPAAPDPPTRQVEAWAQAWSEQRVEDYLGFYAPQFVPASGDRARWEQRRRERLSAPGFIRVSISELDVEQLDDDRAAVRFEQSYESDTFSDRVTKALELLRTEGGWKILSERVLPRAPAAIGG